MALTLVIWKRHSGGITEERVEVWGRTPRAHGLRFFPRVYLREALARQMGLVGLEQLELFGSAPQGGQPRQLERPAASEKPTS